MTELAGQRLHFYKVESQESQMIFNTGLYHAFIENPFSSWVKDNYIVDHLKKKMWPKNEFYKLESMLCEHDSTPISGITINYSWDARTQFEEIGFTRPQKIKFCEILHYFVLPGGHAKATNGLSLGYTLRCLISELIRSKGIRYVFATCPNPRIRRLYERYGWTPIDHLTFENGRESWLLKFEIK